MYSRPPGFFQIAKKYIGIEPWEASSLWLFLRPAYSLIELHDGCRNLVTAVLNRPYVSEVRSKVASLFHSDPSLTPDARSEL